MQFLIWNCNVTPLNPEILVFRLSCKQDGSQWSLVEHLVQHVPGFLPWMLFKRPPLLAQCVDLVRLYYAAVQNLVYILWECSPDHCWKQRHTTDTLCPTCAAIRRYVHPASLRPTMRLRSNGWSCSTGVCTRWWSMVYPRVSVANSLDFSKHDSYCLQSHNRGCLDRSPEHHLITNDSDKWISNTATPSGIK